MNDSILEKLIDSIDDFKERLIRIEENVKGFNNVKEDVDFLKEKMAELYATTKMLERQNEEKDKQFKNLKNQFLGFIFAAIVSIIGAWVQNHYK